MTASTHDVARRQFRRAQIGAACGALGVDERGLERLLELFADEVTATAVISSPFELDEVWTEVRLGGDAIDRVAALLAGSGDGACAALDALVAWAPDGNLAVAARAASEGGPSVARVSLQTRRPMADAWDVLLEAGADSDGIARVDRVGGALRERMITKVGFEASSAATVAYDVSYPLVFDGDQAEAMAAQLDLACGEIGVSQATRTWLAAIFPTLAPRRLNSLTAAVRITAGGSCELRVAFPRIPNRIVLQLMIQFADREDNASRLGALAAVAGEDVEEVTSLTVIARDREPPRFELAFSLDE